MESKNVVNEFGVTSTPTSPMGMLSVAQQREIAEVQSKMIIAKTCPRDEKLSLDRIIQSCCREKLAKSATYLYSRGGT